MMRAVRLNHKNLNTELKNAELKVQIGTIVLCVFIPSEFHPVLLLT